MAVPVTASDHQGEFSQQIVEFGSESSKGDFSAFISDGVVSLVDGSHNVPIRILRDTGALDSFCFGICFAVLKGVLYWQLCIDTWHGISSILFSFT